MFGFLKEPLQWFITVREVKGWLLRHLKNYEHLIV